MIIKKLTVLFVLIGLVAGAPAQDLKGVFNKVKSKITGEDQEEVGMGLKEALNLGVSEAVDFLSAEDGYYKSMYKVLLPEEARQVTDRLKGVPGFADVEENLVEKLNRAAEDAATKAKPIFVNAIKQMTFQDALNILMGENDAATRYLERTTYDQLYGEFKPVIQASLDKVNARSYWNNAVSAYNRIPLVTKVNPELDDYVAKKALEGLFGLVEKKEEDIRQDPAQRTSDLLKKVFAKQDKK